jgi:hypothetical protein|nr:hypothetical protein [Neorhizobium tomejilense]
MSHFFSVSPIQVIDVWDELHSAMAGTNKYGGDVIEFYMYRLMPPSPSLGTNPMSNFLDDDFYSAACNLHAICRLFEERHEVTILFEDGGNIDLLLDKSDLNRHRTHLRVVHHHE